MDFAGASDEGWLRPRLVARWGEVGLVSGLTIGLWIWRSTVAALGGSDTHFMELLMTNRRMALTLAWEGVMLAIFLFYLRRRGWTPGDFRVRPSLRATGQACGLFAVTEVAHLVAVLGLLLGLVVMQGSFAHILTVLVSQSPHLPHHPLPLSWGLIVPAMILNAFAEELTCMGYFFVQVAAKWGPLPALLLTVTARMACHTYQGPLNAAVIGVVFLIYGLWYWRTRNLWPLIFAHAVLDLFSFGIIKVITDHGWLHYGGGVCQLSGKLSGTFAGHAFVSQAD